MSRSLNRNGKDLLSGALFLGFGLTGLWFGKDLTLGSISRMGPGYLPMVLSLLIATIGLWFMLSGLARPGSPIESFGVRSLMSILGSAAAFALTIEKFGILIAVVLLVAISALASRESRWREVPVIAIVMAAGVVAVFVWGLGMLLPIWPA